MAKLQRAARHSGLPNVPFAHVQQRSMLDPVEPMKQTIDNAESIRMSVLAHELPSTAFEAYPYSTYDVQMFLVAFFSNRVMSWLRSI